MREFFKSKRFVSIALFSVGVVAFAGCQNGTTVVPTVTPTEAVIPTQVVVDNQNNVVDTKGDTEVKPEETEKKEDNTAKVEELTEAKIRMLMADNLNCMYNIFILGYLPIDGEYQEGTWIYPVKTDDFEDFAAFEKYVRSVYCEKTADMYLYNFPYENESKYINQDGKLYINMMYTGGKGYYVDWSEYTVAITSQTEDRCEFTLTAKVEWPAENPVKEPYEVKGVAVYENGQWLFEAMYS